MGDIFREIDEELRQERYAKLWRTWGKYVIAAAVALVIGVAGFRGWDYYRTIQRQDESARFASAEGLLQAGKSEDAAALFAAMAEQSSAGYAVLARFRQAGVRAAAGDGAGAVALYDTIASDGSVAESMREAAIVFSVMHAIDRSGVDRTAMAARLQPLTRDQGPWRNSARELLGVLALQTGDEAKARTHFTRIADDVNAPNAIKQRATEILSVIGQ